jgi:hypothetical protein
MRSAKWVLYVQLPLGGFMPHLLSLWLMDVDWPSHHSQYIEPAITA